MNHPVLARLFDRAANSHKYDFGHVLVIGGSPGMAGASLLSARAALRSGAGLVTLASSTPSIDVAAGTVPELMTLALPDNQASAAQVIISFIMERRVSVVAIGPGLAPDQEVFLGSLIHDVSLPLVIDGGALTVLAGTPDLLAAGQLILTPHAGEFQKFFSDSLPDDRSELQETAQAFAKQHGLTLVLKGQPTVIAHQAEAIYVNTTGGPALATAGSGDVLTGLVAAIIAQKIEPFAAAQAAVYLHGLSGDLAAQEKTVIGVIASDIIENIPRALRQVNRV